MTKRPLPKGITERGGSFRVSIMVNGDRRTGTARTLEDAIALRDDLKNAITHGPKTDPWTLQDGLDRYLEEKLIPQGVEAGTLKLNRSKIACAAAVFGWDMLLDDIDNRAIALFGKARRTDQGVAPATWDLDLTTLFAVLKHAKQNGGMSAPMPDRPKVSRKKSPPRYLSPDQEASVHGYYTHRGLDDMADLVSFLADTGLRVDKEALSLPWDQVSLSDRKIYVWKTKTGVPRTVPMTKRVHRILTERRLSHGTDKGPFECLSYRTVHKRWTEMREAMNRRDDVSFTPHILRHTFCTRLAASGVELRTLMELAGHDNLETTQQYAHFIPARMAEAVAALDNFGEKPPAHLRVVDGG